MSGTTRCPQCGTRFRISDMQLEAYSGMVRCGHCLTAFDARPCYIPDQQGSQPEFPILDEPVGQEEKLSARLYDAGTTNEHEDACTGRFTTPIHHLQMEGWNASPGDLHGKKPETAETYMDAEKDTGSDETTGRSADEAAEKPASTLTNLEKDDERVAGYSHASMESENDIQVTDASPPAEWKPPGLIPSAEHIDNEPVASEPLREFLVNKMDMQASMEHVESSNETISKQSIWPWLFAPPFLLALLLAQTAYFFRIDLASRLPYLKPALSGACQFLGCSVPLPQRADLMSIESSEMEADQVHANLITLNALLRNRATYAQAFPNLELTLNDSRDGPLARRIFKPKEYLPSPESEPTGLLPGQELSVKLQLDTSDLRPAGYRLVLLYLSH